MAFNIKDEISKLPETPGVYMHKDSLGEIIYVGKAINLKRRVSSYFSSSKKKDYKVKAMVSNIREFEYISCATELEALLLECNLIKQYMPKYNILMKDDKTYPYIAVTLSETFPRVIRTRETKRNGDKYYGPYSDSGSAEKVVELIEDMYPIKKCSMEIFPNNIRPCLYYHIGKCKGVCIDKISKKKYMQMIDEIVNFLDGKDVSITKSIEKKMIEASENLNYEEAAEFRDYLRAINSIREMQRASNLRSEDADILIPTKTNINNAVIQYNVRDGKLVNREVFYMENADFDNQGNLITEFIKQHYVDKLELPKEILLENNPDEEGLLADFLDNINKKNSQLKYERPHKTRLVVPIKGNKKKLVEMAKEDTLNLTSSLDERAKRNEERRLKIRDSITRLIEKASELRKTVPRILDEQDERDYRVEAYDVSNMNGVDTVSAMVVYDGLKPAKKDYRKFKIRLSSGDDYAALSETIKRRMDRAKSGDLGFIKYPDIIFVDGGIGQVRAVINTMESMNISIPTVGLAKDDSHRTRAIVFEDGSEILLINEKILYNYAGTIQEEVHRFAITFQRNTRKKRMVKSVLEDIKGVGPKRRRNLLEHFKSIEGIKKASYKELIEVDNITKDVAENIIQFFSIDL